MRSRLSTALVAILAVALLVRVGVIVATPDFKPIFDAADYERHAASLAAGDGYAGSQFTSGPAAFRPPLYPLALAAVDLVGGGWTAQRLLGALLGVVTVLLVFLIAERLWGRRTAIVAGAIAAVFPPLVALNASLLSEVLFIPLTLAALLAVLRFRDDERLRWAIAAGLLCGLAILTRTSGAPVVLALALGVWSLRPRFSRAALLAPAVLILVTALMLVPWVVRNTTTFDRWVGLGTAAGYALAGTYNAEARAMAEHPGEPFSPNILREFRPLFNRRDLNEAEFTSQLNDEGLDYMREHPGYVVETVVWNVPRVLEIVNGKPFKERFQLSGLQAAGVGRITSAPVYMGALYLVLVLALLGIVAEAALRRGDGSRRAPPFFWAVPILLLLPALAIYGLPRYRTAVDPFLVMLAAAGVVAIVERVRRSRAPG